MQADGKVAFNTERKPCVASNTRSICWFKL